MIHVFEWNNAENELKLIGIYIILVMVITKHRTCTVYSGGRKNG